MTTTKKKTTAPKAVTKPAATKTTAKKPTVTTKKTPVVQKYENTFQNAMKGYWTNAFEWGRATRSEYWWCALVYHIGVGTLLALNPVLFGLWAIVTLIPSFTVMVRRLHDTNRSAWNALWLFLPYVGVIVLLVLLALEGDKKANTFGKPRI